ncbi:translation initiation factor IF-2 [Orientia chuto str. Dubai]|uniref:Translation initiation factor IF-2 n=1 Tax=Orientia chuto str. Dubai TaxID=1359168 RepID=A0A0F3MJU9_9RICK|nr:translation initiation factor IF-2 [Candidatus Orientia mediorientalis]KJV55732.1 translation initiation factor IF-2 [Orientia chuto str. Dubai]
MIDKHNREGKDKKLKLPSKMVLGKHIDPKKLKTSYVTSYNNSVTVEIKSSGKFSNNTSLSESDKINTNLNNSGLSTTDEFNEKISLLKRAASFAKNEDYKNSVISFSSINTDTEISTETDIHSEQNISDSLHKQESQNIDLASKHNSNNTSNTVTSIVTQTEYKQKNSEKQLYSSSIPSASGGIKLKNKITENNIDLETKTVLAKSSWTKKSNSLKPKKADIYQMLDDDPKLKPRSIAAIKRARDKEKRKLDNKALANKIYREVIISDTIAVNELALRMSEKLSDVMQSLLKLGINASANQNIDVDTAELVAVSLGHSVKRIQASDIENILHSDKDTPESLLPRAPVVTVMGHVDHGKTCLLDALRSTDIISTEAGGITQHIGAYKVTLANNKSITFVDTPGHEAFSEIRTRGAKITDIVVLVIAANDGIKPQTIEAINHAKAAQVPILVAINKIDAPDANPDKIKNALLAYNIISEDLGGETIVVQISALKKINLDKLEEAILLLADMLELKANSNALASGTIIESEVDAKSGIVATALVQRGTLKIGDILIAGNTFGKVKRMINDKNQKVTHAYPSDPVKILGLNQLPKAGDAVSVVQNEKQARNIVNYRIRKEKEEKQNIKIDNTSLEELLKQASMNQIKELSLILKTDVHGSLEAIVSSINKIVSDEVKVKILHAAVGVINESDIILANASNATILGFNVKINSAASIKAEKNKTNIKYYSIIYDLIDYVKSAVSGMLSPIIHKEHTGSAEVRAVFNITKVGNIAGCYVTKGYIQRDSKINLLRDNKIIFSGALKTLKRFKEHTKDVKAGSECGIELANHHDIKIGDIIEAFTVTEEKAKL